VDDTICIGKYKRNEALQFKKILNMYEKASHEKTNLQKTKIYFLNYFEVSKKSITKIWGCKIDELSNKYLGMPLFVRRFKSQYWDVLVQKIQNKLIRWKEKCLSYEVKLVIIKSMLQSMPVYSAMVFKLPITISDKIDKICIRFLWLGDSKKEKITLVS